MILSRSALYGPVAPIWDSWYVVIVLSIYVRRDDEQHYFC